PMNPTPPAATPRPVAPRPVTPARPTTPPRSLPGDDAFGPNPKTFNNDDEFNSPFERDGAALKSRPYEETGAPEDRRGQVQPVSTPLQLAASATTVVRADHDAAASD